MPGRLPAILAVLAFLIPVFVFGQEGGIDKSFQSSVGGTLSVERLAAAVGIPNPGSDEARGYLLHFVDCDSDLCKDSLRAINDFVAGPLAERGLVVVGFAAGSTPSQAESMSHELGLVYTLVADPDRKAFEAVALDGVPRTVILDAEERVVYQHVGYRPGREAEYRAVAESVLDGLVIPATTGSAGGNAAGDMPEGYNEELYARDVRNQKAPGIPVEQWINPIPPDIEGKYRLVDFWATWCGPCRAALEEAEKLHARFEKRVVTMAISDEDAATVRNYVESKGLKQPVGIDTQARAKGELAIRAIPHALLINPEGIVIWQGHPMELWMNGGAKLRELVGE